jgi:hypothetical protein
MKLTKKPDPFAAPKSMSDEKFHRRAADNLWHVIMALVAVISIAEVILAWNR